MKKIVITFFVVFSTMSFLFAQQELSTKNKKAIQFFQKAYDAQRARDFESAKELLYEAISKDPNFVEAYVSLGSIHKVYADHPRAKKCYEKIYELKPDFKPYSMIYFYLAEYYLGDGKYEEAKKVFEQVLKLGSNEKRVLIASQKFLKDCDFAMNALKNPMDFKPLKLSGGVNNFYINSYPTLTGDRSTMIYYVIRDASFGSKGDIMVSKFVNGNWAHPESISDKINTDNDEGAPCISADGKVLVFAACNRKDSYGVCDLYISYKEGDQWTDPMNMGKEVNSAAWDSEPSVSADGRTVYFSSERPGGFGARDIWMSVKDNEGNWTKAKNLGKPINSPGDEVSPFIHANNNTLYFSSNFFPGMGGYDVFIAKRNDTLWAEPVNAGYPLNTNIDNSTLSITVDGKKGYYTMYNGQLSRTNPTGFIYEFDIPERLQEKNPSTFSKGTIYDNVTKLPIKAKVELIDLKSNKVIQQVFSDKVKGDYLLVLTQGSEYALYVSAPGYVFKSTFVDFKNPVSFNPVALDVYLDPIKPGVSVVLNNIFFPTNEYTLEEKSKTELIKIKEFLNTNPKISLELSGHTDNVGSDKNNLDLSQKRAKSVYDFLISLGVDAKRIKHIGYGESKPIADNENEEGRALNRRIEFKIL